ncbi:hypothetical protein DV515_00013701, partial [Chloebia gouldiae]
YPEFPHSHHEILVTLHFQHALRSTSRRFSGSSKPRKFPRIPRIPTRTSRSLCTSSTFHRALPAHFKDHPNAKNSQEFPGFSPEHTECFQRPLRTIPTPGNPQDSHISSRTSKSLHFQHISWSASSMFQGPSQPQKFPGFPRILTRTY